MSKNKEYTEQAIDSLTPILEEPQYSLLGNLDWYLYFQDVED